MSRCHHLCCDFARQNSFLARFRRINIIFSAIALGFIPNIPNPALAGSAAATIEVSVRVVSSCPVSDNFLQNPVNATQGRFNCPASRQATTSPAAAYSESANYTLTDAPGTNGAVKILTLNF